MAVTVRSQYHTFLLATTLLVVSKSNSFYHHCYITDIYTFFYDTWLKSFKESKWKDSEVCNRAFMYLY